MKIDIKAVLKLKNPQIKNTTANWRVMGGLTGICICADIANKLALSAQTAIWLELL